MLSGVRISSLWHNKPEAQQLMEDPSFYLSTPPSLTCLLTFVLRLVPLGARLPTAVSSSTTLRGTRKLFPETLPATSPLISWPGCHMPWDLNQSLAKRGPKWPKLVQTNQDSPLGLGLGLGRGPFLSTQEGECTFNYMGFLLASQKGEEMVLERGAVVSAAQMVLRRKDLVAK